MKCEDPACFSPFSRVGLLFALPLLVCLISILLMYSCVVLLCPAAYLALYNLASAAGWAFVLFITVTKYLAKAAPEALWQDVQLPLKIVQTAAVLEVFHSLFGLVRSPLMTTIMQVASRVILLWCYTAQSIDDQKHWSLYLMVGR